MTTLIAHLTNLNTSKATFKTTETRTVQSGTLNVEKEIAQAIVTIDRPVWEDGGSPLSVQVLLEY